MTEPILCKTAEAMEADLDGERIVMHATSGVFYGMRGTAADVWQCLDGQMSVAQIKQKMSEAYEVGIDVCGSGIDAFITALIEAKLVVVV